MIYAFITEHAEHPAARWATFFEVSTSGYYSWLENQPDRQSRLDAYAGEVERIFDDSGGTYGADRIAGEMRKQGLKASFRKVKHIMQDKGLYSVHLSYQRCLTDSRNARDDHYVNLLRDADINEPFQALSSDISYIPTNEGFEYTCTIRDILSGLVLSEHTAARMTKELVMETIRSASKQWSLPKGIIFHSDRGSQYTSAKVMEQLRKLGLKQSFSRVGMPGDNAWSESFFSILKKELVHPLGRFQTREQARQAVFAYINGFYNTKRIQKRLGYLSPLQWLTQWNSKSMDLTA